MTPGPPPAHSWLLDHLGSSASTHSYTSGTIQVYALNTQAAQLTSSLPTPLSRSSEIQAGLWEEHGHAASQPHHLPSSYHQTPTLT